ncbi:FAS1 domain-containing protein [Chytridium lagenaria]|nr:FAS1 domain-containing protein [Chytridium lagenaria]
MFASALSTFAALFLCLSSVAHGLSVNKDWQFVMKDRDVSSYRKHKALRGEGNNIWDKLREERDFSSFVELIEKEKGLRDEFERGERMTVFAPTNEAIKRFEDRQKKRGGDDGHDRDEIRMQEVLLYHIIPEHEIEKNDLRDGQRQRIRVSKIFHDVYLNMYARIDLKRDYDADNGRIWGIEDVLVPPPNVVDVMYSIPTEFSTTVSALCRLGVTDKLEQMKGGTVLVPDNAAWEKLGFRNLYHLFSERGRDDLKKILQYHVADDLAYSTKMMRDGKVELETMLKGEKIIVEARRRRDGGGGRRQVRRGEDDDGQHESPKDYIFVVNEGEARIRFTDGVSENGVIHVISEVLVPESVELPDERRNGDRAQEFGMMMLA